MVFKEGDKVRIKDLNKLGIVESVDRIYQDYLIRYEKTTDTITSASYFPESNLEAVNKEELPVKTKKSIRFRMEVDQADLMQGKVIVPWYMGKSYSDMCMSIYYYHILPFNFLARYMRYLYYAWFSWTKGPEHFVIMDRRTFEQVQRCEYERGRIKSDEYLEKRLKNLSNR